MAEITAALVKELREKSGAGMMDCKKALSESDGDFEKASEWLRSKGLAAAAKKSDRIAAEGLVAVNVQGNTASVVEVNSETDFVGRNEQFQSFVSRVAEIALTTSEDSILSAEFANGETVETKLVDNIATIGENQTFRRSASITVNNGVVASYTHNQVAPNLGKIGVIVGIEGSVDADLAKHIAMHVAAVNPKFNTVEEVDHDYVQKEREFLTNQALEEGKPADIVEKMIDGRMKKFLKEIVLLEQVSVIDGENTIGSLLEKAGATLNSAIRFELGDGIEKKEENFAEEVAKTIGS